MTEDVDRFLEGVEHLHPGRVDLDIVDPDAC